MEQATTAPEMAEHDCYSLNGEDYHAGDVGDALDEIARDEDGIAVGRRYWLATMASPKPSKFFVLDDVLDGMTDRACDDYGEYADGFLGDLPKEKRDELQALVAGWLDANVAVTFFRVTDAVARTVTQEDVDFTGAVNGQ